MRPNNAPKISITLTSRQASKIFVIQRSISDPTIYSKIIDGLIDIGFSSALHNLQDAGTLNDETYQKYIMLLSEFMRE